MTLRLPFSCTAPFSRAVILLCALLLASTLALTLTPTLARADWREGAPLPSAVPAAVGAQMDGGFYVMSGAVGAGMRSFFELYDLRADGWRPLTPLPVALSRFSIAAGGGRVFVTGGRDAQRGALSRQLWLYMPQTALWLQLRPMPVARAGHASFIANGRLFVIGGIGKNARQGLVYDIAKAEWRTGMAAMPLALANMAATHIGDEIILAGGVDARGRDSRVVLAYNTKTDKWRRLAALPQAASGGALVELDGALHYAGGYSQGGQQVLDGHLRLVKGRWVAQPAMKQGLHQMAYAAFRNRMVIIGGALGGGFYANFTASDRVAIYTRPSAQ